MQEDLLVDNKFFASLTRSFSVLSKEGNFTEKVQSISKKREDAKTKPDEVTIRVEIPDSPEVEEFLQLLRSLSLTKMEPSARKKDGQEAEEDTPKHSHESKANESEEPGSNRAQIVLERVMETGSWSNEGVKQLLQLYEICIAPINDFLPGVNDGEVPRITIIPHEFLFSVPFCCLHNGNNEYFIERFVLSYAPSLTALLLLNERLKYLKTKQRDRNLKLLAMGHATMALPDLKDLPCSGEEAKHVQAVFGPELCQLALRRDATKKLFLRELKNVDILHVATHACPKDIDEAADDKPLGDYSMQGCLLLASSDDHCRGVVNASEIASVDCRCQMITLSCCETGLGKVTTGDGVIGLYRAFFAAGATSVLVTLWKIRDDITTIFMEHFYNEFKETRNVPGSLRSAMLFCIRSKKLPPQQWAAFSFIGAIN